MALAGVIAGGAAFAAFSPGALSTSERGFSTSELRLSTPERGVAVRGAADRSRPVRTDAVRAAVTPPALPRVSAAEFSGEIGRAHV